MKTGIRVCLSAFLLFGLVACRSTAEVNELAKEVKYNFVGRVVVDSIVLHDSVFVREKADTVYYTKYHTLIKERVRIDTVWRSDTVYCDREVVVEKEVKSAGNAFLVWIAVILLLVYLLHGKGVWRGLWSFIVKGFELCIKFFRLKG